jgi:hypothetical protein
MRIEIEDADTDVFLAELGRRLESSGGHVAHPSRVLPARVHQLRALADQTLAHRLVVVYAKSGLGKKSLLNAGLAHRLREEGFLPLVVRVNDVQRDPLHSVLGGIAAAADRQGVEHIPGEPDSLWAFFKTAECWRGDLLLTPVLILGQFEELFTLQAPDARAEFLEQLSSLVRGVPPPGRMDHLGDEPPPMRIVLCLREDYLGVLEEAADPDRADPGPSLPADAADYIAWRRGEVRVPPGVAILYPGRDALYQ